MPTFKLLAQFFFSSYEKDDYFIDSIACLLEAAYLQGLSGAHKTGLISRSDLEEMSEMVRKKGGPI